jgi:hypothetical protein
MTKRYFSSKGSVKPTSGVPSYFRGWKEWEEGDTLVGVYHSTYETEFKKQKQPNFRFKVLECNFKVTDKDGKTVDPVGKILTLNSAGQLNKFMKNVEIGMVVIVPYAGKRRGSEDDDTEYHTFDKEQMEAGWADEAEGEGEDAL